MSDADQGLITDFVAESLDHLADAERQLLEIEASPPGLSVELINTVFRAVHSIKGTAGFLGLHTINRLSHHLESVLNLMRSQQLAPNSATINAVLQAVDCLRSLLGDVEHSNEANVSPLIDALLQLGANGVGQHGTPVSVDGPLPLVPSTNPDYSALAVVNPTGVTTPENSIRVPVQLLDELMNLAGELVLGRNRLLLAIDEHDDGALQAVGARLNQVTAELEATIMRSRMQPIGNVFTRFGRIIRDLSGQLGKQCNLVVEGQEVELDKAIIEAIGDPLTHLIRNSLDHGLEMPEHRVLSGKPATGTIRLTAAYQSGGVKITIEDDGAGIDGEYVKVRAVARGLISTEQAAAMTSREALRLIFVPGFSTAEQITELSGRGVGMDVVKTNIARLGGTVDVETKLGGGTTIDVKLPLTLAIMPSLIVRSGGQRFAIPQNNVREIVRIRGGEVAGRVERIKNALVLRLRGHLLPLVRLSEVLTARESGQVKTAPVDTDESDVSVIVIEAGRLYYGLIVDAVDDAEEIVVKPLGRHLKNCLCFTGAAVLGDGRVALILDVGGIADHAELAKPNEQATSNRSGTDVGDTEEWSVLVFSNAPGEQFAVASNLVKRIERITADQVDSVGGCALLRYDSRSLPLLSLEDYIRAAPRPDYKRLYVVIFEVAGREIGLLVPRIHEIRSIPTNLDTTCFRELGVLGSIVLDRRITRIVDLLTLAALADTDRNGASEVRSSGIDPWPSISCTAENKSQMGISAR